MQLAKVVAAAALITAPLALSACTAAPQDRNARVIVRVAPAAHQQRYDIHLAQAKGGYRSAFRLESGQTRTIKVPVGWMTVRVAGLCVVSTPVTDTMTVEVDPNDCALE